MKAKGERIVCLTAYDAPTAEIAEAAGVDVILVGDSVGNVVLGYPNTLPVTLEQMIHHTEAAARGVANCLLVADLPFGAYQDSPETAVRSSVALVKAGAHAVKLEGSYLEAIEAIIKAGIPVMGHLGFTPQSLHSFGGFRLQGKNGGGDRMIDQAREIELAGAFSIVLELIPARLAKRITDSISIPTIGIGAGMECDGQIQVFHDVTGLSPMRLKHAKRYVEARELMIEGLGSYAQEVRARKFPAPEHGS